MATVSSGRINALLATRRRDPGETLLLLLSGLVGALVGVWIGVDLRGLELLRVTDHLFYLLLAASAPLPIAAVGALYHERVHAITLPWPVSGGQHLALGVRLMLAGHWPWWGLVLGAAASGASGLGLSRQLPLLAFVLSSYAGAWLISLGAAGLCAGLAAPEHPRWVELRANLSRSFAPQHHAPFLYLPAISFAAVAVCAAAAQTGALRMAAGLADPAAWALLAAPLPVGGALLAVGALAYRRHALRVIPRVHEAARTIYGGEPAPADPPYGLWLTRLMPRAVAPYYGKELREQARGHRGLWALVALLMLGALAYAVNVGQPSTAAPLAGIVATIWVATMPVRRSPRQGGGALLLTLPLRATPAAAGRWLALLFAVAHVSAAVAVAVALRHGARIALVAVGVAVAASWAAMITTRPRADRLERWGPLAPLVPAVALAAGLAALSWIEVGLLLLALLSVAAPVDSFYRRTR